MIIDTSRVNDKTNESNVQARLHKAHWLLTDYVIGILEAANNGEEIDAAALAQCRQFLKDNKIDHSDAVAAANAKRLDDISVNITLPDEFDRIAKEHRQHEEMN